MKPLKTAEKFANEDFISSQAELNPKLQQAEVFGSAEAFQAVAAAEQQEEPVSSGEVLQSQLPARSAGGWWLAGGLALVGALALLQWVDFVSQSLQQSALQGGAALTLSALVSAALVKTGWSAWRARRQQRERVKWRELSRELQSSLQYGAALPLCRQMAQVLPDQNTTTQFFQQQTTHLSDAELIRLFDLLVLQPADVKAEQAISVAAKQTGVAVAVSPFALADLLLVGWRAMRLLEELAQLYGVQVSLWQRLKLVKKFANLLFWTGATELAIDIGGDFLGVELSSKLSARAGQGVLAGLMLARLGRFAQREFRPVPLAEPKQQIRPLLQSLLSRLLPDKTAQ